MKKSDYLKRPRSGLKARKRTIDELLDAMSLTAFQGRKLGEALNIWKKMILAPRTTIFMGLSGAMVPAGMGPLISFLIKKRAIDVLVTTGAALSHDLYEVMGFKHYIGTPRVNDDNLQVCRIDRVYDVYADEDGFLKADMWIADYLSRLLKDDFPYSSREVAEIIGRETSKINSSNHSILTAAYKHKVPIFTPAFGDSSIGFAMLFANRKYKRRIVVDTMRDVDQICRITEMAKSSGVVLIGGGVPKNYIQQTAVVAGYETNKELMHNFGIAITTDSPQWGGLSGCTFEESKSWGKYDPAAIFTTCYCDATIALPFLVNALAEWNEFRRRKPPQFNWKGKKLKLIY